MRGAPLAVLAVLAPAAASAAQEAPAAAPRIRNPYFETTRWKVWRDDASPVADVQSMVRDGKARKAVVTTLRAPEAPRRLYPAGVPGRFLAYAASPRAPARFAGIWDDVYASWSGLHGWVRSRWKGPAGDTVSIHGGIIEFANVNRRDTLRAGVNFVHQSTTGMAHTITNGYSKALTERFEKLYFADVLVCAPAHLSWTDVRADRSQDLYMALCPTLFNSVGSSNSETMAITKMIAAGGYLRPETKRLLKRNGLYPSAMLYIWKAALPYDVPYGHELRHRLAYKSVGNRETYPERYSAAGIGRGDMALPYHRYDDAAHMRNMVALAKSMDVAPPEAVLKLLSVEGGRTVYALKKSVLVVQEKGRTVRLHVSTADSYDLQSLPVSTRWRLLYGSRRTRLAHEKDGSWTITVPPPDDLPEGRTCIALIANNGRFDGNPAVVTVYRKKGPLPPDGASYGGYRFSGELGNRRPVVLDLQDVVVRPGSTVRVPIRAVDPEGFGLRFFKRTGEVGTLDGSTWTWHCPSKQPRGRLPVTILVSDGTSGDSYGGGRFDVHVGRPEVHAHITAGRLTGKAPFTLTVSAKGSFARRGRVSYGWEFYAPSPKHKPKPFQDLLHGKRARHTFDEPGVYEVSLTLRSRSDTDTQSAGILVTAETARRRPAGLVVEGKGVELDGDRAPADFDATGFGPVGPGAHAVHDFLVRNTGDAPLRLKASHPVTITGPGADAFSLTKQPRTRIEPRGSSRFEVRYAPHRPGAAGARVTVHGAGAAFTFRIRGTTGQGAK